MLNTHVCSLQTYLHIPSKRRRRSTFRQYQNLLNDKTYANEKYGDFYNNYLRYVKTTTPDPLKGLSLSNIVALEKALGVIVYSFPTAIAVANHSPHGGRQHSIPETPGPGILHTRYCM